MSKLTVSDFLDAIKELTVGEMIDLVKACEKEFDVSASAGVTVINNPGQPLVQQTEFDVELTDYGPQKIKVIKVIREITKLGLKEAKELVESAPKTIREGVSIEEAESLKAMIEEQGAKVTIK